MSEIETVSTYNIECPACHTYIDGDSVFFFGSSSIKTITCGHCNKEIRVSVRTTEEYTATWEDGK
jgi:phage FluMu protein Com